MTDRKQKNQGMNWIRPVKRLAIYLRDGMACCYCGAGVEQGAKLTLDHLKAYSNGGSNNATNLVTCCAICNSSRGNRSWKLFAAKVAGYINHGATTAQIIKHVELTRNRKVNCAAAQALLDLRGGFSAALKPAAIL
jgi:hypothetical protein